MQTRGYGMKTLKTWTPVAREAPAAADLPEAAARVLAEVDGNTPIDAISERTGMAVEDVLVAMGDLVRRGTLDATEAPREVVQLAHMHARPPSIAPAPSTPLDQSETDEHDGVDDAHQFEDDVEALPELEIVGVPTDDDLDHLPELEVVGSEDDDFAELPDLEDFGAGDDEHDPDAALVPPSAEQAAAVGSYRQVFETTLRPLPVEVRVEWAQTGSGDVLFALCMDPMPGVIQAVLENPHANLEHARLIAEHHRHPIGLDALGKRSEYIRDSTVRRFLLRNQQASERLLMKMLGGLPLTQVFRANVGHELTDRARRAGRMALRRKFDQAQADEKVALIVQTEGRCLANLVGLTFDQKTVALLCRRTYPSSMLIQSLARFPATPPTLIVHLLRQQGVLRNAHVKKRLQQHPNCPKYLKR
jgi:hypothetical protein